MQQYLQHYINGQWVDSDGGRRHQVINPATEQPTTEITLGTAADVEKAVAAARAAFETFSQTTREERLALLERVKAEYAKRMGDLAASITAEMGCPISLSETAQAGLGLMQLDATIAALKDFEFEGVVGKSKVLHEAIGVVALITPWNWPMNQIVAKVAPCLAAGNTMILKPSEQTPGCAAIFAEIMDAAGVPVGVFNLVQGDGPGVGTALAQHPGIDMISFTGSTRAGIEIARNAAGTVKRVHQELGGKSPNILLESAKFEHAIPGSAIPILMNSGQTCVAPTRMLVHKSQHDEAVKRVADIFNAQAVGDPAQPGDHIGPVVNKAQYEKIQGLIEKGIAEGATLAAGGPGRADGQNCGYYVRPTLFANVTNDMTIAREEIFGPVLCILPYEDEADAIRIANDTPYGLAAYVKGNPEQAQAVAAKLRAGCVYVNAGSFDLAAPFGGYKQSGNGREGGKYGITDFMEVKTLTGVL